MDRFGKPPKVKLNAGNEKEEEEKKKVGKLTKRDTCHCLARETEGRIIVTFCQVSRDFKKCRFFPTRGLY